MHIKQLIISGFRSFKDQREVEPFSPHHNVIVGRNGSGKSNFFNAIQFVLLAPKFATLRQEDRQHLLHEGAGSSVMAAYVEIIFDNTDGRFPVDSDEVVLRRTVGHKKDEFFLNRKRIEKSEVFSLLESAGFSKSNPYYIVQQGKVAHLCVMKDQDRLELLKEVAGTTVYEERRGESTKILQETAHKQERIAEILTFIEERLEELEQEKDELKEYDNLDKRRRALEYHMYDKDLARAQAQLAEMEDSQDEQRARQHELYATLRTAEEKLQAAEEEMAALRDVLSRADERREGKGAELKDAQVQRSRCEADLQAAEARDQAHSQQLAELQSQRDALAASIAQTEQELTGVEERCDSKQSELTAARERHNAARLKIESLYGKQGRGRQFSTPKERDVFLRSQLERIETQTAEKSALAAKLGGELEAERAALAREATAVGDAEQANRSRLAQAEELSRAIEQKLQQRNALQERRKQIWKGLEDIHEEVEEARTEQTKGRQMLSSTLPRVVTMGLAAVERIVEQLGIEGYHGPVIDNFTLKNENFRTCVEVAAGNALFHVVVDDDRTAARLMQELERQRAGRLTFLPLNRLTVDTVQYPQSPDAKPLLDIALEYEPMFEPALRHIFGKKLLARDMETGARFSKEFDLDCITRDGDLVNRKGGFEGGYHDDRVSRCAAVYKIRAATTRLIELTEREKGLKASSDAVDAEINTVLRDLRHDEVERDSVRRNASQLAKELSVRRSKLTVTAEDTSKRQHTLDVLLEEIQAATAQSEVYHQEIGTALTGQLTHAEREELTGLEAQERDQVSLMSSLEEEHVRLLAERDRVRAHLKSNLQKRYFEVLLQLEMEATQVEAVLSDDGAGQSTRRGKRGGKDSGGPQDAEEPLDAASLRSELTRLQSLLQSLEIEVEDLTASVGRMRKEQVSLERTVDALTAEARDAEDEMATASKEQDKLLNKRSLVTDTIADKQRLIRELGSVPRKESEEYKHLDQTKLLKHLKDINEKLKKYATVNRKAMDQYVSFNEQRDNLISRRDELEGENESIQLLIESLDRQKDETILSTFSSVSKHFTDVFDELVPGGHGELVMRTDLDDVAPGDISGGEGLAGAEGSSASKKRKSAGDNRRSGQAPQLSVSTFQGVAVRVSFSGSGQQYSMQQLSGGQKALVALSLIFAIQRCDPAPFYLFDEIDQALDASYRTGVARLIQRQVQAADVPAQFITTTFRPEMVAAADKCYGILLRNKVSNIYPLQKDDAERFVTTLLTEEEAVGRAAIVPSFEHSMRISDADDLYVVGEGDDLSMSEDGSNRTESFGHRRSSVPGFT